MARVDTHNPRTIRRLWQERGGQVEAVRRTGEERWTHPAFEGTVRANARRHDIPAVILCRLNHLLLTQQQLATPSSAQASPIPQPLI